MKLYKDFFRYVLPSMLAFALSGLYGIVDGFFLGNEMGDQALAAINVAYPLTAFLQAVGTGIGMGGAVQYTINKAQKKEENQSGLLYDDRPDGDPVLHFSYDPVFTGNLL